MDLFEVGRKRPRKPKPLLRVEPSKRDLAAVELEIKRLAKQIAALQQQAKSRAFDVGLLLMGVVDHKPWPQIAQLFTWLYWHCEHFAEQDELASLLKVSPEDLPKLIAPRQLTVACDCGAKVVTEVHTRAEREDLQSGSVKVRCASCQKKHQQAAAVLQMPPARVM